MSPVWLLWSAQALATAVAGIVAWIVAGADAAGAALFGGAIVLLPGLWFAWKARTRPGTGDPKELLGAFYKAEVGKLLLTALLFIIGAKSFGNHFAALMLTCIACLAMNWLMLAFAKHTDV